MLVSMDTLGIPYRPPAQQHQARAPFRRLFRLFRLLRPLRSNLAVGICISSNQIVLYYVNQLIMLDAVYRMR